MTRTWKMYAWNGKKYVPCEAADFTISANGPQAALKKAGLLDPMYTVNISRRGYGYYAGRIEVRAPETIAAAVSKDSPLPADFLLLAED